ncbi:MAG: pyridoxal-dependent decarboxylase, exosortase A system-associated [Proteobacteria bacterium]|nr:pyridoxal-dependent decarboxylase, exosortase A system-associated [Pseudomonadota bacterium]
MNATGQHPFALPFPIADDSLLMGGVPISLLAERVGQTPFYAYDRHLISERVAQLRSALPADIHLHFAVKSNPMPAVVQHLAGLVDGFDVASAGELKTVLDTAMAQEKISFAGPGKTERELRQAVAAGIVVNAESEREILLLGEIGTGMGLRPKVAVRVNPDFELKSSGMKMGGGPRQFGIDAEVVPALLARIGDLNLDFYGFHIFSGSQNLRAESIMEAQEKTFDLARRMAAFAPGPVRLLNLGGGFGIPYFPGEQPLDLIRVGGHLSSLMPSAKEDFPEAEFVIELGRYIVGEAGVYVCRVIDRKISRGQVFLVADGGLHHHLAASGNFGQVIRKNYPVLVGNRVIGEAAGAASVVGPLCTPLDLLADKMDLGHARVGDLIVVLQSGAYGFTASPRDFLGHPQPVEILV